MDGSWHIYRPGTKWRGGPAYDVRVGAGHRRLGVRRLPAARHRDRARRPRRTGWSATSAPTSSARTGTSTRRCAGCASTPTSRSASRCSTSATWPASATSTRSSRCSSAASTRGRGWPTSPDLAGTGRAGPHADAGQPAPPRAEHHRRSAPRPGPLGVGRRGKPCFRCGTAILLGEQGPPTQERVTWWCPPARRPAPRSTRRPAPASPTPAAGHRTVERQAPVGRCAISSAVAVPTVAPVRASRAVIVIRYQVSSGTPRTVTLPLSGAAVSCTSRSLG